MSGALSKLLRDLGKTVAEQQASRRGIDVRLSRAEGKAERASTRLRTLRVDAMQGRSGVARVSLLFGELSDEIEQAVEEATERAIEQAAAEAGKKRPGGLAQLPPPSERWKATLGELRTTVEAEHRAATDANASAHAELQALRLTSYANVTRLEEHKARLEEQLASLRATYEVRTAASAYVAAAPPMAAAAGGLPAAVSGGMLADAAQPSNYLPAPFDGRVASSQPTASVGEGDSLAVRTYRGVAAPEVSTAVVDYLADAATSAVTAQAAPLAAEQTAPLFATQLSTAAPLTTALATALATAPSTTAAASERTSAQPSSPDAAAPPQSAVAEVVTTVATTPAVTTPNPCAGKRCPAQYDMVDRGDHCSCRPASAPPQSRDV